MASFQTRAFLFTIAISLASISWSALATPIYVNGSCGNDANTGASPECNAPSNTGPKLTIQAAINAASVLTEDVVIVADGNYSPPLITFFILNKNITVKSANGPANCTLTGSGYRLFNVQSTTSTNARIEGFTMTGGDSPSADGGAILLTSPATIAGCTFTQNSTVSNGGAIAIESFVTALILDCIFEENAAVLKGGAVRASNSVVQLERCTLTDNVGVLGGGAVSTKDSHLVMIGCTIEQNQAGLSSDPLPRGGGVLVEATGSAKLVNCVLKQNRIFASVPANRGFGAGMAIDTSGTPTTVDLVNCLFIENGDPDESTATTKAGGGLHNRGGALNMDNCTFVGNGVTGGVGGGGAAYFEEHVTSSPSIFIDNSIFWGNFIPTEQGAVEQIHLADTNNSISIRYCDVDGGEIAIGGTANPTVTNLLDADPLFAMSDPDHPYRLRFNSPCRDRASSSLLPADEFDLDGDSNLTEPIPFDIEAEDEHARNVGCAVDIGAYEVQGEPGCPGINPKVDIAGGTDGFPDGQINVNDLLAVVGNWDATGVNYADIHTAEHPCGDGVVNVNDLLAVIGQWGPCGVPEAPPDDIDDCFDYCESLSGQQWQDCLSRCFAAYCSAHPTECD